MMTAEPKVIIANILNAYCDELRRSGKAIYLHLIVPPSERPVAYLALSQKQVTYQDFSFSFAARS